MKKSLYQILLTAHIIFTGAGCDSSDDSHDGLEKLTHRATVTGLSESTPSQKSQGIVRVINTDRYTVYNMLYTEHLRLRSSGSGFNNNTYIEVGDLIEYDFFRDQVDFGGRIVRPITIRIIPKLQKEIYIERN